VILIISKINLLSKEFLHVIQGLLYYTKKSIRISRN